MKEEFIETTCNLIDRKLSEMEVQQDGTAVRMFFSKSQIEHFRECLGDDDDVKENEVALFFKSGENIIINMSYDELKQKINEGNPTAWQR